MIIRLLDHVRSNAIACTALFLSTLALAGGAYAAVSLPSNSVGARQIRNHAIDPIKLNPGTIGGSVRHWAQINAQGKIVTSSGPARQSGVPLDGDYVITWSEKFSSRCVPIVTVLGRPVTLSPALGFANARVVGAHPTGVWVSTYNPQGVPTAAPFSVAVVC